MWSTVPVKCPDCLFRSGTIVWADGLVCLGANPSRPSIPSSPRGDEGMMMVEECVPWRERTTGDSQISPSKKSMSLNQETESMSLNQENRYARKIRRDGFHFHIRHYRILRRRNLGQQQQKRSTILRGGNMISIPSQGSANNTKLQSTASPERQKPLPPNRDIFKLGDGSSSHSSIDHT